MSENENPSPAGGPDPSSPTPAAAIVKLPLLESPVGVGDRIESIDVLRGVAVLGILMINIEFFALPMMSFFNPAIMGGFSGINLWVWKFSNVFFLQKMMAIFSMLFGAGLILMYQRADASGRSFGKVYYRRLLWLGLIGLAHAYFFWYGDILFTYAVCGLLLFPLRRRSPRALIILSVVFIVFGALIILGSGASFAFMKSEAAKAQTALDAGETATVQQTMLKQQWEQIETMFKGSPEQIAAETSAYQNGFLAALKYRAPQSLMMQTQAMIFQAIWRTLGLMLLGMALLKLGILSGGRSLRFYVILAFIGFGIGLPLTAYGAEASIAHGFDVVQNFTADSHFNYFGSILVSLAYISIVMIISKRNLVRGLQHRLAAVGRTAFSNYLLQTLICTTIFYGYGLGLFGRLERIYLLGVVLAVWIFQLYISPIWLRRYRLGPAEWLWRSLTYRRRQPFRVTPSTSS